jgi:hypothetical protein
MIKNKAESILQALHLLRMALSEEHLADPHEVVIFMSHERERFIFETLEKTYGHWKYDHRFNPVIGSILGFKICSKIEITTRLDSSNPEILLR